jgi:hypothetical protein
MAIEETVRQERRNFRPKGRRRNSGFDGREQLSKNWRCPASAFYLTEYLLGDNLDSALVTGN